MLCNKCGKELPEDAVICDECGEKINNAPADVAETLSKEVEGTFQEFENEAQKIQTNLTGQEAPNVQEAYMLQTNRSLIAFILLSIITCGIYRWYFIYKMSKDINVACQGDGKKTSGLFVFLLLSFITCGIYDLYWEYKIANRMRENAPRYGLAISEGGASILLWYLVGWLLCFIGPFVAMHILIKNSNAICAAYNGQTFQSK